MRFEGDPLEKAIPQKTNPRPNPAGVDRLSSPRFYNATLAHSSTTGTSERDGGRSGSYFAQYRRHHPERLASGLKYSRWLISYWVPRRENVDAFDWS